MRIEEFEKRLTPRTKMVLLTHPNNPTTTVYRRESIEALCRFIIDNDLVLVCDQAFEDHIYDGIDSVAPCTPARHVGAHTHSMLHFPKGIGCPFPPAISMRATRSWMCCTAAGERAGRSVHPPARWAPSRPSRTEGAYAQQL